VINRILPEASSNYFSPPNQRRSKMIRRYSPRPPRRPYQDFHFFAAPDPVRVGISSALQGAQAQAPSANLESKFARPEAPPPEPSQPCTRVDDPEPSPPIETAQIPELPPAPPRTIVKLWGPRERAAAALQPPPQSTAAAPAANPRPKPHPRKRAKARLATPRPNRPKPKRQSPQPAADGRTEHERRCSICSHPDRADIENEFMHWHSFGDISDEYDVSRSAIYRHAYALSLFVRRNRNLRFALGHLVERVQDVEPTADSVVRAIHAFARVNDEGEWIEPPAHVIVSSGGIRRETAAGPARRPIAIPLDSQTMSNVIDVTSEPASPGTVNRVEPDATR
jgi:hypothetical protein